MQVSVGEARERALRVLRRAGASDQAAECQVDLLLEADLRGHASHGLARLPVLVRRIRSGLADPVTTGRHEWRLPAVLSVDGMRGLGPVVALAAVERLSARARDTGVAVAGISNSNHLGMLGWYVERIAASGQIGITLSTSEALVHPFGGRSALLGTNPLAIGIPATPVPFIADLATGAVSMGKIHDHRQRGETIPDGWALDMDGAPTRDPGAAANGSIAPFGGAKGYALGLAVELLVTSLTEAALGTEVRGTLDATCPCNKGDVFVVIDCRSAQPSAARIRTYLDEIRNCPPVDPGAPVTVPGDRSRATRRRRLSGGIPLSDAVWAQLCADADEPVEEGQDT